MHPAASGMSHLSREAALLTSFTPEKTVDFVIFP
jgi:hypothetical protein